MINIKNLTVKFGETKILNEISLNIKTNKFTTLLGPNGSGKSTIIKAIAGHIRNYGGDVLIFNQFQAKISRRKLAQRIAFMFQFNKAPDEVTVYEFVSLGRIPFKTFFAKLDTDDHQIINNAIITTKLSNLKNRKITTLSGGEMQRVFLAMCIAQQPKVLILDEPTNHLDIKYQFEVLSIIRNINIEQKITVLCVLHDINLALKYSDELIFIKDGCVNAVFENPNQITEQVIAEVFDVKSIIHRDNNGCHIDFLI